MCISIGATTYSYLKCIVYDKLLKSRQSFRITLYFLCVEKTLHKLYLFQQVNLLEFYLCDTRVLSVNLFHSQSKFGEFKITEHVSV